jgi:hypothetical protein
MKPTAVIVVIALLSTSVVAAPPKAKKKGKVPPPVILSMADMEVGKTGVLAFPLAKPVTLLPLKVEDVGEGQFIGTLTSSATGKRTAVIVRGVKTDGLVSGRYYQLGGVVRVSGTEEISSGETVFVLEPVEPDSFALTRSDSPDLVRPR